ncbi:hypothetical protein [Streptomyces sp. NPDC055134]
MGTTESVLSAELLVLEEHHRRLLRTRAVDVHPVELDDRLLGHDRPGKRQLHGEEHPEPAHAHVPGRLDYGGVDLTQPDDRMRG